MLAPFAGNASQSVRRFYMALVNIVSFSLRDGSDNVKALPFYFLSTQSVANMQAWITTMAPLLDAVTDAKIESVSITVGATLPAGLKASAVEAGNRVREGAGLSFAAANTSYKQDIYIPAWHEAFFVNDELGPDTEVGDFTTQIIASGGAADPTDRYGNDITALTGSGRVFRK